MIQVKGAYPPPPGIPADIPGLELAGEVVGLGPGATRFAEGDRVMGIVGGAGQAELATVHERQLMPVPDGLGWEAAGGLPETFTTAHDAIFTQAELKAGERLLVSGAAGGVGTAGVQLGRAAGARVVATVRNTDHHDEVAALGAQVIVPDGFEEHGPFDVVLELVGAPNLAANLQGLATNGRIVVIGTGAGSAAELDLRPLMLARGRLMASTLRSRPLEEKAMTARRLERHVLPLFETGALTVPIAETFPLDRAAEAYDRFRAGRKLGKIVLTM
jgi:NADPH:quinone reductase